MTEHNKNIAAVRRRLNFRSWHRGTKELDLLFGPFADARLEDYDAAALAQYEDLLMAPDPDVYSWIVGLAPPDPAYDTPVLRDVIAFQRTRHA
ncbi:MAG: succinate dehydrogenase assembly factor 2 [Rhodospirillaceae bacterium]|nr:succinate dehydrogenase assembly factor 2 [Rhodospirillaceae bacterium]MCY4064955.1 succinate dehydrogenase assembly factor 2 [Rhodospirillaceae bacterium]MXW93187.1 succinate dehydrogenase assembly factor 2 [Rhodospirillaceae bacterium]MYB13309.1 succinate dehydrogenase assembly factor 2 [Rhodospirillaceae bacterium]MYI48114.1 succinate dehydrogenase assembly factor 2 [Rhodospirillaceae bacterium]